MKSRFSLFCLVVALALLPSTAFAVLTTLTQSGAGSTINLDSTGADDIRGYTCNCPPPTGIRGINGTGRASSPQNWANTTFAVAQAATYVMDPSNGGAIPSGGDVLLYRTADNNFYKLRLQVGGTNTAAGIEIEYEFLGSGAPPVPVASFTSSSVDIFASFTDTSTNSPTGWAWTFGDGGTSGSQNPNHNYAAPGTYNVCLIASNGGGPSAQVCNNITVTADPGSVTIAPGSGIDFDNDNNDDLAIEMVVGCGAGRPNRLNPMNGAEWAELSKNYDLVVLADAQAATTSTSPFCSAEGNPFAPLVILASGGNFYKVWTPTNDAGGIRFIFALLGTPPPVPTAAFTFTTLDLIATFTNTSTGTVTGSTWDFDDTNMSTAISPTHIYASAGTYMVCLVASNAGGNSAPFCQNVTVAEVPSTTVPANSSIDFDGDSVNDLLVMPTGACGTTPNSFVVQNGAQHANLSQAYASVNLADAQGATYGTSIFCHPVSNPNEVLLILTSAGNYVKAWVPAHPAAGPRFQFEVLIDNTPDAFMFTDQTDVPLSTAITSDTITVAGINTMVPISVTGGMYSIGGGPFTGANGMVSNGDMVTLQQTSSANFSTTTDTVLDIGGVMDTFSVTTLAEDLVPDPFVFTDQTDVDLNTVITSNTIMVNGINSNAPIMVTGGMYSVNGLPFTMANGTVSNGDMVTLQQTSSANFSTTTDTLLDIGGVMDTFSVTTLAEDLVPDPFVFTDQTDVDLSTPITSDTVTITGINSDAPIMVTGGMYSINGGPFTGANGIINDGDMVTLQQTSSANFSTTTDTVLDIGGVMDTFSVTTLAEDLVPDPFVLTDQTDVDLSTLITSDTVTISGINSDAPIMVTGGMYSINGGPFTGANGIVNDGDTVTLQQTSSANFSTTTDTVLDIGGVMDTFSVTTLAEDLVPDPFMFTDQTDVDLSTPITSDTVTISGINSDAPIMVTGGMYSINGGPFTGANGIINDGDTVALQQTSSANFSTTTDTVLDIGGVMDTFSVTTLAEDLVPDPFTFPPLGSAMLNVTMESDPITVTGINSPTMISIVGGEYSINGGPFTSADGMVENGDVVVVRVLTANATMTTVTATLTIGGVSADFSVTTTQFSPFGVPTLSQWALILLSMLMAVFGVVYISRRRNRVIGF